MKSAPVRAFFSCSFHDSDQNVNDFFRSICEGLDISCSNVDSGHSELPPEKARAMISGVDVVIAVATARNKFDGSDQFSMPEAVSNEISFAYSFEKPLLVIKENNVRADGFLNSYGTHLIFDRSKLNEPDFLRKAVTSIHNVKLGSLSEHEFILSQEVTEFIAEKVSHLFELERDGDGFVWQHSMQRTINFTKNYNKPLKISRWNDYAKGKSQDGRKPIEVLFEIIKSSRNFEAKIEYDEHSAFGVIANIYLTPTPAPGDSIEYFVAYRGPDLIPTYLEDIGQAAGIEVMGRRYAAADGIIPVNRAKDLEIQFRVPRDYKISESDADFFVGSFVQGIEYVVDSEIERAHVKKKVVGGKLEITAKVTSPLLRHVYGVAWNPPPKPKSAD